MSEKSSWNNFWKIKRLCSVGSSDGDYVNKSIQAHWDNIFGQLVNHTKLLDVGTGNGVLPYLAALNAQKLGKEFCITAVDLADINPVELFPELGDIIGNVKFIGNVDSRELPVKTGSQDIITSQYAIEYMPREETIIEFYRCLKKGGEVRALLHSVESETYKQGKSELQKLIEFKDIQFIEQAMAIYKRMIEKLPVESLLDIYNSDMRRFTADFANKNELPNVFKNIFSIIGHTIKNHHVLNTSDVIDKFSELESELSHHINRVSMLCQSALNEEEKYKMEALFLQAGFSEISCANDWQGYKNMGIQFKAIK